MSSRKSHEWETLEHIPETGDESGTVSGEHRTLLKHTKQTDRDLDHTSDGDGEALLRATDAVHELFENRPPTGDLLNKRHANLGSLRQHRTSSSASRPVHEQRTVSKAAASTASTHHRKTTSAAVPSHAASHTRIRGPRASSSAPRPTDRAQNWRTHEEHYNDSRAHFQRQQQRQAAVSQMVDRIFETHSELQYQLADADVNNLESKLDAWTTTLKQNVLSQFSQFHRRSFQTHSSLVHEERTEFLNKITELCEEIVELKQQLGERDRALEVGFQSAQQIGQILAREQLRRLQQKCFFQWKTRHNDVQRAEFCNQLARLHRERVLKQKAIASWFAVIQSKWRVRVERACQARAEQSCEAMCQQHEARIAEYEARIATFEMQMHELELQKAEHEDNMKKAFMRGVCALNMETLSIFTPRDALDPSTNGLPSSTSTTTKRTTATESTTSKVATASFSRQQSSGKRERPSVERYGHGPVTAEVDDEDGRPRPSAPRQTRL